MPVVRKISRLKADVSMPVLGLKKDRGLISEGWTHSVFSGTKDQRSAQVHSEDIGFSDIWTFLVRRRIPVVAGIILGGALGLIAFFRAPRLYTATVTVEMNRDGNGLPDLSGAGGLIGEGSEFMTDMLTQQAVLMGDSTALSVINRLNLMSVQPYNSLVPKQSHTVSIVDLDSKTQDQAIGIFKNGLRTVPVKNTRLLAVSYTDQDPARAAQIANSIVEAYLENHTKTRYDATAKASTWLTDQLDALKRNSEELHLQVSNLERKSGVFTTPPPPSKEGSSNPESINSNPEYQRLSTMNEELSRAEIVRIEKEAVYRMAESNDPNVILGLTGTTLPNDSGGVLDPSSHSMQMLQTLRTEEGSLKVRLAAEEVSYGSQNPIIIQTKKQIQTIQTQMGDELKRMTSEAKDDYLLAKANEDALRKTVQVTQAHLMSLGDDLSALSFLREEETSSRRLYQDLYRRLEEANIAAGVRSSGMAVDDPARVPSYTSSPVMKNYMVCGLGAGLLAGILAGLIFQVRDTLLYTPEEFERSSPYTTRSPSSVVRSSVYPILGVVPGFDSYTSGSYRSKEATGQSVADQAWILRAPKSQLAESYRQIRTSILLSSIDNPPRVLLITSALSGDGKTTTAYNLAAAFATQATNVLLIGADMRRPSLPIISGLPPLLGLSDVLSNRTGLSSVLQQHPLLPSLKILQSGTIPPDPAELLGSKRFAELINDLRSTFEYIVIDSPPVIPVTDSVVAGASADVVVTVVRAGRTRKPDLKEMWASLDKPTIRVLGFVVNDYHNGQKDYNYEEKALKQSETSRERSK